jgi:phosphopantetheinyl transferase
MLNHEPTGTANCHIAWVSETRGRAFSERWATPDDRAYAAGRKRSAATLLALAALRALLFAVTGQAGWPLERAPNGKPSLRHDAGQHVPSVSLSHTPGLIAVAVALRGSIGVDVERHRPRDFAALADHAFGPAERREVADGGSQAFYRIWTLREAIAKATGDGLALVLNRADLADASSGTRPARLYQLFHTMPQSGFSLGVALLGGDGYLSPQTVDLAAL